MLKTSIFIIIILSLVFIEAQGKIAVGIPAIDSLYERAKEIRRTNTHEAIKIANKTYKMSKDAHYNSGIQNSLRLLTYLYYYKGELDRSFEYIFEALNLATKIRDFENIGKAESTIGMLNKHLKEYGKAIEHYANSIESFEKIDNQNEIAKNYNNIANIHSIQKNYKKAVEMYDISLDIKNKLNDKEGLSKIYNNLGNLHLKMKEYEKAIEYFTNSINIKKELDDIVGVAVTYSNISEAYKEQGRWNKALENLKTSENFAEDIEDMKLKMDINWSFASIYQKLKDYPNTFEYFQKYTNLKDSVFTLDKEKEIAKIREQYEAEKKDKQIELQNAQIEKSKTENTLLFAAVSFLLILAILISVGYYQKKKSNRLLNEQKNEISQINNQLKEANKTKDSIFSIIAHDLRSPVVSLINMSDVMKKNVESGDLKNIKKSFPSFNRSVSSVNLMMENLFNWAVIQRGTIPFNPTEFDITDLAEHCMEMNKAYADLKNINLIKTYGKEVYVFADINMARSIINNLLNNAIKFTGSNGTISVGLKETNGSVEVIVEDTGEGIPADKVNNLFNFDSKKIKSGTKGEKGTGLGLLMCKEFAERNNGEISIESKLGKGTAFTFKLPIIIQETIA
ncbi:MAG: tetratricopeptide repeat-containing sensor histidine kinase [Ignavibacteria bacterium]|jgi:signal transduction histidine kinase